MADDNQQDSKKGFPNSFLFFLLASVFVVLMVQNFVETRFANVSFSYQLEHLVNLKLIEPEESRKTALNDNLVTFSGRFRDALPADSKQRYKYLSLLQDSHQQTRTKADLQQEMATLRERMKEAADWYLHLSGMKIPSGGFRVIDEIYDTPEQKNSLIVTNLSSKEVASIQNIESQYAQLSSGSSQEQVLAFGKQLLTFVKNMRSAQLGIGVEATKRKLKEVESALMDIQTTGDIDVPATLTMYGSTIVQLTEVLRDLTKLDDGIRLSHLRSVRGYTEALQEYQILVVESEDVVIRLDKAREAVSDVIWHFDNQELSTRALEQQDPEQYNQWFINAKEEWEEFPVNKGAVFSAPDQPLSKVLEKTFKSEQPPANYFGYLINFLPVILVVLVLYFLFSRQMKGMGNNAMNFGKSPAKLLEKGEHKVTFKDVAGADEALEELEEIVEFLKNPQKFTALGGRIPKGVLCVGPPGTGKTLIARAVAGEADRPFFSISGSDFVEMFVGVGASRIRDMFTQAKKNAPCIIFMDEIDAVGRHRGAGVGGGHDEREQTLNQLLVEMDGFDSNEGVILMAATNRPDVLDKALLRPGRFDRRVVLGLPDIKGRYEILKVHARKIKLDDSVDLMSIARSTPGVAGAELENILNEAALLGARRNRTAVTNAEVAEARDKVMYGKERRSLELDENDKLTTAYHEAGHAIVSLSVEHSDPVDKVTIIPRGMSLGATMFLPKKNRNSYWKQELLDQLKVLMGGRCAEQIFVGDISSGAQQDISQATNLARSMVCEWGMSDKIGPVAYNQRTESGQYLGMQQYADKTHSEDTARTIDDEVSRILDEANTAATKLIKKGRAKIELMTQMLMEFETLDSEDVQKIMSGEWDIEEKRKRMKIAAEKHKRTEVTPPPAPPLDNEESQEVNASLPATDAPA
ncbi:ATP-dependent zinc metalloprotease FtsH [Chlamydiales bacterium SCGC AG-110-P3]|nr:ATP-dependent zinc metalloprotease FtsH [Chlamydiales bacterium SCGC AG-110-P3]